MEGEGYHKQCFKCAHGGCPLTHSSYAALNGVLYCKHHFQQLFMVKGDYNHVLDAVTKKNVSDQPPENQGNAEEDAKTEEAGAADESESKEEAVKRDGDSEQPNEQS